MKKILVVSPHPDDETLGAGGTLLKSKKEGNSIFWLNFTDMSEDYRYSSRDVAIRQAEIRKVQKAYSFDGFYNLGLKPAGLGTYSMTELIEKVKPIICSIEPNTVILPFKNDIHTDHGIVFDVVFSLTKVFRFPGIKKILAYEVISETDYAMPSGVFLPNYFVDITDYLQKKLRIMSIYEGQMAKPPFPRCHENIEALARVRGSAAGCRFAESFMLIKEIV